MKANGQADVSRGGRAYLCFDSAEKKDRSERRKRKASKAAAYRGGTKGQCKAGGGKETSIS